MTKTSLTIGDLAKVTATKVETIRYYERIVLLPAPARTQGNYRSYTDDHLRRQSFVRRNRELDFTIADRKSTRLNYSHECAASRPTSHCKKQPHELRHNISIHI